ncbi:hypothetical protein [Hymenobacter nivis]|uniref:Uncharacterized protein n=1 Tax=Hymenobacter nivis TaxID=1850093 RepID=A0A502HBV4_9BACT|nr:hypothetical protein [Hymenobacter nivis]TPG71991.1 hypothetical protein EAH73_01735 [Hymenobacter nivis]
METAAITAWLASDQPYAAGVAFYAAHGTNPTYQRLFSLGETPYSRQVLARELAALVGPQPVLAPVVPPPVASAPAPGPESPLLADLRQQRRECYDARSLSHAQLTAPRVGPTARLELAFRVLMLTDHITELTAQEAHVLAHGRLPGPVPTADVSDAGTLRQRLANLRSRRSKLRARPDRADALAAVDEEIALIQLKLQS